MAQRFFETRSHSWREAGLARQLSARAVKRARIQLFFLIPIGVATYVLYDHRKELFGVDTPARVAAAVILLAVGWQVARDIGKSVGPAMFRRMDPATAGTVGFLLRLVTILFVFVDRDARRGSGPAHARGRRRVHRRHLRSRGTADARQPDRRDRAAQRAAVQGRRPRPPPGRTDRRHGRGRRQLARPALHDVRQRRGLDHGPQQRCALSRGRPAARARGRRPARAPARRHRAQRGPGAAAGEGPDADARRAADPARGARRRRGRRPDPGDSREGIRRPEAGRGSARGRRAERRAASTSSPTAPGPS